MKRLPCSRLLPASLSLLSIHLTHAATLTWDSGDTGNGSTIDAAGGTWDLGAGNLVWNNAGTNVAWSQTSATAATNAAIFGGADGTYAINLTTGLAAQTLRFQNSGYTLSAASAQTLRLSNSSGTNPTLSVDAGKTATIGANVTVQQAGTAFFGSSGATAGGTLVIASGGIYEQTASNTWAMDGSGSVVQVKSGGILRMTSAGSQFVIGATTGASPTLHVDGGSVLINGTSTQFILASGTGAVSGTLTLDSGSVSMATATTRALTLGGQAGNTGTVNLNGGTLSVRQLVKGHADATGNFNFNGGTLRAVSGASGATFMTGLTRANVRNGGAVVDTNGFSLTIGQALEHSNVGGDNAIDGGLTKKGTGTLTLTGTNTYTGVTSIQAGTLALTGAASINNSSKIDLAGGHLDVSGLSSTFEVKSGQTLTGSGNITGNTTIAGIHAVGNSPGLQTFSAGLQYLASGVMSWELMADSTANRGITTGYDAVNVSGGSLSVASGATIDLIFNASGSTTDFTAAFWDSDQSWLVIDLSGSGTDGGGSFTIGSISLDSNGASYLGEGNFVTRNENGDHYVDWIAVPEPSAALLGSLSLLALLRRRRS